MFKLSLFAIALIVLDAANAGTLEWPANLVALSQPKSSQVLPLPVSEESAEIATESSANANSAAAAAESDEDELSEASSGNAEALDGRLVSAVPLSVPLPLIVAARPGLRTVLTIREPALANVGNIVEHVPTAISHQSQTVVHDHRRLVTPIVAPAVRTTQLVRQQPPLVWTVSADPRLVLLRN
ncbi:retinin [Drosophila sulfurigaster albostrigata]|uniref:retinin n=1 Tax=Drosophila sulfurigaster albostrigata TaxID=89887 RepID=UPI002D21D6B8|nr:retinin [Drosophila sulfurigaster albostrigata]